MNRPPLLPSGLRRGVAFLVPDTWSAEQALAVFELLDDLREVIATRYIVDLQSALREQREPNRDPRQPDLPFAVPDDDF
jgi:hypothetical protein